MELCSDIYKLTNTESFSKDFALKDQIRKSAISIPSNISEGYERNSKNQFIYFLTIAKGSCGELRTQLKIANFLGYADAEQYESINSKCLSVSKQLSGFMNYLKQYQQNKNNLKVQPDIRLNGSI